MRIDPGYRLGNIIDWWYGKYHVIQKIEPMPHIYPNTLGAFMMKQEPRYFTPSTEFLEDAPRYWWEKMSNLKSVYPDFNRSVRHVMRQYFRFRFPPSEGTCVIHFRLGDFLRHSLLFDHNVMIRALDKLPKSPTRFEIMNGGRLHLASQKDIIESDRILKDIKRKIKRKFPKAQVVLIDSDNADDDFYRMVKAPMLVTGLGSFAILAAACNKNFRLTPALRNVSKFIPGDDVPEENVYENWYTYSVTPVFSSH